MVTFCHNDVEVSVDEKLSKSTSLPKIVSSEGETECTADCSIFQAGFIQCEA